MNIKKFIIILLLILGFGLLIYPFIGNVYNYIRQIIAISDYNQQISQLDEQRKDDMKKAAEEYNKSLTNGNQISSPSDPFAENFIQQDEGNVGVYNDALKVGEIMGYVKIPSINVDLPIYDNTSEYALRKGVGYLNNTSLPIGGESTHCVLTGHTALSSATLLSDLDKVKVDDLFYIRVLDEIHTYRVDQIKVVFPTDTSDLRIENGKDYISLVTCTPYGINTHRLIVRGIRDDDAGNMSLMMQKDNFWSMLFRNPYLVVAIILVIIVVIIMPVIIVILRRRKKIKNG